MRANNIFYFPQKKKQPLNFKATFDSKSMVQLFLTSRYVFHCCNKKVENHISRVYMGCVYIVTWLDMYTYLLCSSSLFFIYRIRSDLYNMYNIKYIRVGKKFMDWFSIILPDRIFLRRFIWFLYSPEYIKL